jgi:hypothetical protein
LPVSRGFSRFSPVERVYYNLCAGKVWDQSVFSRIDLKQQSFTLRKPLSLSFCWKAATP